MRTALIIASAIGIAAASAGPARAQDKTKAEKLFVDQKCTLCHSIGGHGNSKGPLDGVGSKLTPDEIRQWITNANAMTAKTKATRKPPMMEYHLPKADVDALVAYLSGLKSK